MEGLIFSWWVFFFEAYYCAHIYTMNWYFPLLGQRPPAFIDSYLRYLCLRRHQFPKTFNKFVRNVSLWCNYCLWRSIFSSRMVHLLYGGQSSVTCSELHHEFCSILLLQQQFQVINDDYIWYTLTSIWLNLIITLRLYTFKALKLDSS